MPQNSHGARGRLQVAPDSLDILGPDHQCVQVHILLWHYLQVITQSYPGIIPTFHNLQPGHGCHHLPLGDGGGDGRSGHGGTWTVDTVLGAIFLRRKWNCRIDPI